MKARAPAPTPPSAEGLEAVDQIKIAIMVGINENLKRRGWSYYRAVQELDIEEKSLYRVRNYEYRETTVHWLVALAERLGEKVKITVGST